MPGDYSSVLLSSSPPATNFFSRHPHASPCVSPRSSVSMSPAQAVGVGLACRRTVTYPLPTVVTANNDGPNNFKLQPSSHCYTPATPQFLASAMKVRSASESNTLHIRTTGPININYSNQNGAAGGESYGLDSVQEPRFPYTADLKAHLASLMMSSTPPLTPVSLFRQATSNSAAVAYEHAVVDINEQQQQQQSDDNDSDDDDAAHYLDVVQSTAEETDDTATFEFEELNKEQQFFLSTTSSNSTVTPNDSIGSFPSQDCVNVRKTSGLRGCHTLPRSSSRSYPSAQLSKKRLSFADDHGLELVTVHVMHEPSDEPPRFNRSLLRSLLGDDDTDDDEQKPAASWHMDFVQPASDYLKFRATLADQSVALENVVIKNSLSRVLATIRVKNTCYRKNVFVRYTLDGWSTFYDRAASHQSGNDLFDTFTLAIDLPPDDERHQRVDFCVCFRDDHEREHWDNNGGKNFALIGKQWRQRLNEQHADWWYAHDKTDAKETPPTNDAFTMNYTNWTEFRSWKNLNTEGPYW